MPAPIIDSTSVVYPPGKTSIAPGETVAITTKITASDDVTVTVTDGAGGAATKVVDVNVVTPAKITNFFGTAAPAGVSTDPGAVNVGIKWAAEVDGQALGVRFHKGAGNTGAHVVVLYGPAGELARANVTGETASGWQNQMFAAPVPVTKGTVYTAAVFCPVGHYSFQSGQFATKLDVPPLHAPVNAGVYTYGASPGAPTSSYNAAGYGVDVAFSASTVTPPIEPPPVVTPPGTIAHGQDITAANTGRAGATSQPNFGLLSAVVGAQTYATSQTIRNKKFQGPVKVTGGTVVFEFCEFAYQPPSAQHALQLYNNGNPSGDVVCNWCDIDSGLRGDQGTFESDGFAAGERGSPGVNNPTNGSKFTLNRCRFAGYGNLVGAYKWRGAATSTIRECHFSEVTAGGGTHRDGIELYSAGNVTIERSRFDMPDVTTASVNVTTDFGDLPSGDPIIVKDSYFAYGYSAFICRWKNQGGGTYLKNARFVGNRFGDQFHWGRVADFNTMNVTYDEAYALANPTVIYWATSNVWAPNGEHVSGTVAISGDTKAGLPHVPGQPVTAANFYGGEVFVWNGKVVGPTPTDPPPVIEPPPIVTPPTTGWPDTSNTGIPTGTVLKRVPEDVSSGPGWVWDTRGFVSIYQPNTLFDGYRIRGNVDVAKEARGSKVSRCEIGPLQGMSSIGLIVRIQYSPRIAADDCIIEDCKIYGVDQGAGRLMCAVQIQGDVANPMIRRIDTYNVASGIQVNLGTIRDCYIHDMGNHTWTSATVDDDHVNGTTEGGTVGPLLIEHNAIFNKWGQTDAISLFQDWTPNYNVTINNNLIAGGGYCIYGGAGGKGPTKNIRITNNQVSTRFYPQGGSWGWLAYFNSNDPGNVLTGNRWYDGPNAGQLIGGQSA